MPWLQLTLSTNPELAPRLSDLLDQLGATAVTMQDRADQPLYEPPLGTTPLWSETQVTGMFPAETDMEAVRATLSARLAPTPLPEWQLEQLDDQDWERAWMEDFQPMPFGKRLWIVPSWYEPPEPDAVNILLDPGLAFGTGTHPTTRLCLEWLDATDLCGKTVIDYGCGSGILAVAAALLGAKRVIAIDNDPQALQATAANADKNGVREQIEIYLPEAYIHQCGTAAKADVMVANILAGPLIELASHFATLVAPGAPIALSGILPEQADKVRDQYLSLFRMADKVEHDGWIRLEGERK